MTRTEIIATPAPACAPVPCESDPDILAAYAEDASGVRPGRPAGLMRPQDRDAAATFLRSGAPGRSILCQAARSSLTAGAVPRGEVVINVERLSALGAVDRGAGAARVRVGAGVRLDDLQEHVARAGWYYPPVPTYRQAMIGGTVSTNAGGAATFKYGVTRHWVHGITVLLHDGDRLDLERGEAIAPRGGHFTIRTSSGLSHVPTPVHSLPDLKKISAGYYSGDPLDLIDLFIGSEGTLGLITDVTVDLVPLPPAVLVAAVFCANEEEALRVTSALRAAATKARRAGDPLGPDVRAIELLDGNCLKLLRDRGFERENRLTLPQTAGAVLLIELECENGLDDEEAERQLSGWFDGTTVVDAPLPRLLAILRNEGVEEGIDLALPSDHARQEAIARLREGAPTVVAEILAARKREHPGLRKIAGDMIVPFAELGEMMAVYRAELASRGLEYAIWGHVSDGNLHPNVLVADEGDVSAGIDALRVFAEQVMLRGGAPLSEHGVGRDPVKQELLRRFVGVDGIEGMRAVRRALDPEGRFAPGTLFSG